MRYEELAQSNLNLINGSPSEQAKVLAAAAQTHALLAVAEQLRAANLISLFLAGSEGRPGCAVDEFSDDAYDRLASEDVRKALTLKVGRDDQ